MMYARYISIGLAAAAAGLFAAQAAQAQATTGTSTLKPPTGQPQDYNPINLQLYRSHADSFTAGEPLEILIQIAASQQDGATITAMGLTEVVPPGWTFNGMGALNSGVFPNLTPQAGAEGQLDFAWFVIPQEWPVEFSYFVNIPEGDAGPKVIEGYVEYRQQGGAMQSDIAQTALNGIDNKPPVISLLGENPLTVELGDLYADPGFTATDNVDGDVSGQVQVDASGVNTGVAGTYLVTYTVRDAAGNQASTTRTVRVVRAEENTPSGGTGGGTTRPRNRNTTVGGAGFFMPDVYDEPVGEAQPQQAQQNPQQQTSGAAAQPASSGAVPSSSISEADRAAAAGADPGSAPGNTVVIQGGTAEGPGGLAEALKRAGELARARGAQPDQPNAGEETADASTTEPADKPGAGPPAASAAASAPAEESAAMKRFREATARGTAVSDAGQGETDASSSAEGGTSGAAGGLGAAFSRLDARQLAGLAGVVVALLALAAVGFAGVKMAYKPAPRRKNGHR